MEMHHGLGGNTLEKNVEQGRAVEGDGRGH